MKHVAVQAVNKTKRQLPFMILFGILFAAVGWFAPYFYHDYIDKTVYYKINSSKVEEIVYKPCDVVPIHIVRRAIIPLQVNVTITFLKDNDGNIAYSLREFNATVEPTDVPVEFVDATNKIPCDLKDGKYFFRGSVKYNIDRVTRTEFFQTNPFDVRN